MNWKTPVAALIMAVVPTAAVAAAYRREGLEEPHVHAGEAQVNVGWNFDERVSIVSGSVVYLHQWATQVRLSGTDGSRAGGPPTSPR